jgi:hypothetical protein
MPTLEKDFTIGADPEFCILKQGDTVEYNEFYREHPELFGTNEYKDEIGLDGGWCALEVRPRPSKNPLEVVANIHNILRKSVISCPKLLKYRWKAGAFVNGNPIGGHIHFGVKEYTNKHTGFVKNPDLVKILDNYLALPSLLLENRKEGKDRRDEMDCGYGLPKDYRSNKWGFEYRVCSSWITSPYIAAAFLCLAKTIVFERLNNNKFKFQNFGFTKYDFAEMNTCGIRKKFPIIWEDITKMSQYQVYKPYIDLIYFLIKNNKTWFPTVTLQEAWGITNLLDRKENRVDIGVLWQRYIESIK